MVSHHAISGCNLRNGDLYGCGTISDYVSCSTELKSPLTFSIAATIYTRLPPRGDEERRRAHRAWF